MYYIFTFIYFIYVFIHIYIYYIFTFIYYIYVFIIYITVLVILYLLHYIIITVFKSGIRMKIMWMNEIENEIDENDRDMVIYFRLKSLHDIFRAKQRTFSDESQPTWLRGSVHFMVGRNKSVVSR